jgi:DNA-binding NtrC family response regulator
MRVDVNIPFQISEIDRDTFIDARPRRRSPPAMIGASAALRELKDEISRVAQSDAKVLITGESGVGKDLVASRIHALSPRASRPYVAMNCAGLPETLLESELFGHVKGSFTGAHRDKPGKLETANLGTVFLDEVGEMSLRMQGLLLRFLETGELQKVGSDRTTVVKVRVIAATNRDLTELIAQGLFRQDLYYRLHVIHLHVAPLRDRREDIPPLIEHFLTEFGNASGAPAPVMSPEALAALQAYAWPGNVRQLENIVQRLVVNARSTVLRLEDLPGELRAALPAPIHVPVRSERRHTISDRLYRQLTEGRESFWTAVYPLYMDREITRQQIRELVRKGLEDARGNYKIVTKLFNIEPNDYKKFLNFLRKHDCQLPYRDFR